MATEPAPSANGSQLYAVPDRRDLVYDVRARQASLPLVLHHPDGEQTSTVLVLDGDQMHRVAIQLDQAIDKRNRAGHTPSMYADATTRGGEGDVR